MNLFRFIPGYESSIFDVGREPAFLMLLTFIVTLAGTRFYTRMARIRGWGSGSVGGVHMHHLVPGVIMILGAGVLVIAFEPCGILIGLLAAVFGAGAALTLDEFAILLHLDDWLDLGAAPLCGARPPDAPSRARHAKREARWATRRNRFYDLIGGTPHLGSKRQTP